MKSNKLFFAIALAFITSTLIAQKTFEDQKGNVHLWGNFDYEQLQADPYKEWYQKNADPVKGQKLDKQIAHKLKDVQVKLFLGTWCGDTKKLMPQFLELWKQSGLDMDQIELIGLHRDGELYKRGPNQEEEGYRIHRVPTLVFEKNGNEIGRISERVLSDLQTDLSQIAYGVPSHPRYRAVDKLYDYIENEPVDSLTNRRKEAIRAVYREVTTSSELNTLGYIMMYQKKFKEAEFIFYVNASLFRYDPTVYDSLAEAQYELGKMEESKENYLKVIQIDSENENAIKMLNKIFNESEES